MTTSAGFLTDNLYRSYPLVDGNFYVTLYPSVGSPGLIALPYLGIADFGCILGAEVAYNPDTDVVYLSKITNNGSAMVFEFLCTSAGAENITLIFSVSLAAAEFTAQIVDTTPSPTVWPACNSDAYWEGFLVVGRLNELAEIITAGSYIEGDAMSTAVEPGLIQSLAGRYLRSLNIANVARTAATRPEACGDPAPETSDVYVVETCLTGDIKLKPGYNTLLIQNARENGFRFGASVGAGEGEPCGEVKHYPDEEIADGQVFYTGGQACNELIKTINGVSAEDFNLVAGQGVKITITGSNSITLDVDYHDMQVC